MCSSVMPSFSASRAFRDDFLDGELEAVGVAFLAGERAELAAQDAVIGVIDVAVDDVAGAVAGFLLPREIRDGADGVQVLGFKQPQRVRLGNAFARGDLVVNVAQLRCVERKNSRKTISRNRGFGKLSLSMTSKIASCKPLGLFGDLK